MPLFVQNRLRVSPTPGTLFSRLHPPFIDDDGQSFRVMAQRGRKRGEEGTFSTLGGRALVFNGVLDNDDPVEVFNIDVDGFDSYFVGRESV